MSVVNGQNADAATFNAAFASKSADNTLTGKQTLSRPGSGASIVDTQQAINDVIASDALKIPLTQKAAANGVATLDASTLIPVAQVPDLTASKITDFSTAADARITAQKGAANGVAPLDASSKIDSTYLPSYVDDVVEVANYAALPVTGETGKIYVTLDTNFTYRWSGSVYVKIGQPIASTSDVPEGTNLYFTSARVADKQIGIQFQDQGSNLGTTATVDTIDFIGAGITATRASNKVTVEVTATGSGGGSKNYFSQSSINPDFETGTVSPWQAMTTTWSGNTPVNAPTAGAVVTSFYTNIVSPLAGTTSATMTKGNGVGQYEGVMSGVFTIDREDLAKVLYGSFAYEVTGTSAANFDVSGTSTQTLEIWVYNVNANEWIQPAGFRGINQFTGPGKVTFSFQTDATDANNQYRICLIVRQNTSGAWNLKVDDFQVGPQAIVLGTPVTDWKDHGAITIGAVTTAPTKGNILVNKLRSRRVGDSVEAMYEYAQNTAGTTGTGVYLFSLPSGMSFDSTKINITGGGSPRTGTVSVIGNGVVGSTAASGYNANVVAIPYNSTQFYVHCTSSQASNGTGDSSVDEAIGSTAYPMSDASYGFRFSIKAPIAGWSSNVQTSDQTEQRMIASRYYTASAISVTSGSPVNYSTVDYDTNAAVTIGASWKYTASVTGIYRVNASLYINASTAYSLSVYKNGSVYARISEKMTGASFIAGSVDVNLNAGDYIDIRPDLTGTLLAGSQYNYVNVSRLANPSVITATETVALQYTDTSGFSISSSDTTISWGTKVFDTHSSMSSGTVTIPVSGKYFIDATIQMASTTLSTTTGFALSIVHNSSEKQRSTIYGNGAANTYMTRSSLLLSCNAGDTIQIKQASGATTTAITVSGRNNLSIFKVGN
jgi:hypothetical protein